MIKLDYETLQSVKCLTEKILGASREAMVIDKVVEEGLDVRAERADLAVGNKRVYLHISVHALVNIPSPSI